MAPTFSAADISSKKNLTKKPPSNSKLCMSSKESMAFDTPDHYYQYLQSLSLETKPKMPSNLDKLIMMTERLPESTCAKKKLILHLTYIQTYRNHMNRENRKEKSNLANNNENEAYSKTTTVRDDRLPDTFLSCESVVSKTAVAIFSLKEKDKLYKEYHKRAVLAAVFADKFETMKNVIQLSQVEKSADVAALFKQYHINLDTPSEIDEAGLVDTLLDASNILLDAYFAKLAAIVSLEEYAARFGTKTNKAPLQPAIDLYINQRVALSEQQQVRDRLKLELTANRHNFVQKLKFELQEYLKQKNDKTIKGSGYVAPAQPLFQDDLVYYVFKNAPLNFPRDLKVEIRSNGVTIVTYQHLLYDVYAMPNVDLSEKTWPERLDSVDFDISKIRVERFTGAELNRLPKKTSTWGVSWMDANGSKACYKLQPIFKNKKVVSSADEEEEECVQERERRRRELSEERGERGRKRSASISTSDSEEEQRKGFVYEKKMNN